MLKLVKFQRPPTIKVFGVGGAGNNIMERNNYCNISSLSSLAKGHYRYRYTWSQCDT